MLGGMGENSWPGDHTGLACRRLCRLPGPAKAGIRGRGASVINTGGDICIGIGAAPTRAAAVLPAAGYFRFSSIQSTEALTCSSVSAGLPPLGGITPPLAPL